jgi:hypothetical protein
VTHVANLFQSSIRLPVAPREEAEETSSWQIQFSIRFFLSRFVCDSWITFSVAWFSSVRISRAPRVSCSTVPCLWVPYGAAGETGKCWAAPPWWPSVNFRFRHSRNDVTSDPPRLLGLLPLVAFPCFNFSSFSRTLEGDQGRGEKTTETRQQHCRRVRCRPFVRQSSSLSLVTHTLQRCTLISTTSPPSDLSL